LLKQLHRAGGPCRAKCALVGWRQSGDEGLHGRLPSAGWRLERPGRDRPTSDEPSSDCAGVSFSHPADQMLHRPELALVVRKPQPLLAAARSCTATGEAHQSLLPLQPAVPLF
jgi:hypothetical protein